MEAILNFNDPFNVGLLDMVIDCLYRGSPQEVSSNLTQTHQSDMNLITSYQLHQQHMTIKILLFNK